MKNSTPSRHFDHDDDGQILILTAVCMVALFGIAALSIDSAFMYDKRNRLYAAADAAAKSGAIEVQRNASISDADLQTFAEQQVSAHGFTPGTDATVVVHHPPASGPFAGNAGFVEAIVSSATGTFFGGVLGWRSMTPGARAVAGYGNPGSCMILTGPTGSSPYSLEIGNSSLTMNGCGVETSGDIHGGNPNARIVGTPTPGVSASGTCSGTCGAMGSLSTGAPPPVDPLAGLAAPDAPDPSTCVAGTAATLNPGCYTSIADTVTTLNSGVYYITGPIHVAASLTGTNVLLYLTGSGQITAQNNRSLNVTAMTSGTWDGIAIFQDPSDSLDFNTGQNFTFNVTGVVYMPGTNVDMPNSVSITNTGCNLFIAKSLNIRNGNGVVSTTNCAALYGNAAFMSIALSE